MEQRAKIILYPRSTAIWLGAIAIFLLVAHLISIGMPYIFGGFDHIIVRVLFNLFFLDGEGNLPALFSTWLFMMNAALFAIVWKAKKKAGGSQGIWQVLDGTWLALAAIFVFLAIDESISIHERLIDPLRQALDATGIFYYPWIIPYAIGIVVLSIFVIPVIWQLGRKFFFLFVLSAATYLFATIGMEMISGKYLTLMNEQKDIVFIFMVTLEELLEMAGLIILVYVLLLLIQKNCNGFLISIPADGG